MIEQIIQEIKKEEEEEKIAAEADVSSPRSGFQDSAFGIVYVACLCSWSEERLIFLLFPCVLLVLRKR